MVFRGGGEDPSPPLRVLKFEEQVDGDFVDGWPKLKEVRCEGKSVLVRLDYEGTTFMVSPWLDAGEEEVVVLREVRDGVTVSEEEVSWGDVWDESHRQRTEGEREGSGEVQLLVRTRERR